MLPLFCCLLVVLFQLVQRRLMHAISEFLAFLASVLSLICLVGRRSVGLALLLLQPVTCHVCETFDSASPTDNWATALVDVFVSLPRT